MLLAALVGMAHSIRDVAKKSSNTRHHARRAVSVDDFVDDKLVALLKG